MKVVDLTFYIDARLYDLGHKVLGVDGSEQPIMEFFADQGLKYKKEMCSGVPCYVVS